MCDMTNKVDIFIIFNRKYEWMIGDELVCLLCKCSR